MTTIARCPACHRYETYGATCICGQRTDMPVVGDRILGSDAARAVDRFNPDGPAGYRAKSGGPLRPTRAEAEADERAHLDGDSDE